MANSTKGLVVGAMGAAGLIFVLSVLDAVAGIPFGKRVVMDIMFIVAALVILVMGFDSYSEQR